MVKGPVFKLVGFLDDKQVLSKDLSYSALGRILSSIADSEENQDLFDLAAKHSAAEVRDQIATKDRLSEETVQALSTDSSITVLRSLVRTSAFRESASLELIEKLAASDVEIAQSIASDIDSYQNVDGAKLYALFAAHSDPSVVACIASGYSTPKKVLKGLLSHPDSYVVAEAKSRLDNQ